MARIDKIDFVADLKINATKIGKSYYTFILVHTPVVRKKQLYYGIYPLNLTTRKNVNIIEYIAMVDVIKGGIKSIQKARKNLIKKLKRR